MERIDDLRLGREALQRLGVDLLAQDCLTYKPLADVGKELDKRLARGERRELGEVGTQGCGASRLGARR